MRQRGLHKTRKELWYTFDGWEEGRSWSISMGFPLIHPTTHAMQGPLVPEHMYMYVNTACCNRMSHRTYFHSSNLQHMLCTIKYTLTRQSFSLLRLVTSLSISSSSFLSCLFWVTMNFAPCSKPSGSSFLIPNWGGGDKRRMVIWQEGWEKCTCVVLQL